MNSLSFKETWEAVPNEAYRAGSTPAVSVVITLYNYEAYIKECLDSVLASKTAGMPGGFEVIVVDDASTDASAELVEKHIATSPLPVRLIKKRLNTGVVDSRNLGLLLARAPLVFMLDADNTIRPECLLKHYQVLATSDHALAYGIINRFDNVSRQSVGTISDAEWDVRKLVSAPYIDAMAMIRKDAVLRVGGYSIEFGTILVQAWEDYDLWLKLAQAGYTGKFIPEILSDYRVKADSMIMRAVPRQSEVSAYQARKFFALTQAHADLPVLFGTPRHELELANLRPTRLASPSACAVTPRLIQRVLGDKLRRSVNKRLNAVYAWLNR
ncbi:MAG TPA: glycosyltransferase family 2 protein [Verrucomicrobiae bacterium]|nr:glycosyltransferase family 2 protein [Verrucomicrobiae bacterium]